MLPSILNNLRANETETSNFGLIIDSSFAEIIKWHESNSNNDEKLVECDVFSLSIAEKDRLETFHLEKLVILSSLLDTTTINVIKTLLKASKATVCTLITSVSPQEAHLTIENHNENDYDTLIDFFFPTHCIIQYLPIYSINLFSPPSSSSANNVDMRILSSHYCRQMKPITLHNLSQLSFNKSKYTSVNEVIAADLPQEIRTSLKVLANEIAGALVFDMGIDPHESIFALGKTSSLLGHSLLSILPQTLKTKVNPEYEHSIQLRESLKHEQQQATNQIKRGSLILIDRLEDLFTSATSLGSQPLAQRILNTLKGLPGTSTAGENPHNHWFSSDEVDITMRPIWFNAIIDAPNLQLQSLQKLSYPMSAASSLSYQAIPSFCYKEHERLVSYNQSDQLNVKYHLMISSEDQCRQVLCEEIKCRIQEERGQFPSSKKRGLGAEVLAYVQCLLDSPGAVVSSSSTANSSISKLNSAVCYRSESLIALALCIIESMQRSSTKQFSAVSTWKKSIEAKVVKEIEYMSSMIDSKNVDFAVNQIVQTLKPIKPHQQRVTLEADVVSPLKLRSGKTRATTKEEDLPEPVDLGHVLLQIISAISLLQYQHRELHNMDMIFEGVYDYLHVASVEELEYLRDFGMLTEFSLQEILQNRVLNHDNKEFVVTLLKELLYPIEELSRYYYHHCDKYKESGILSTLQTSWIPLPASVAKIEDSLPHGLVAQIVQDIALHKAHRGAYHSILPKLLERIESSLKLMARTGLGLLSKGLGKLGFGGNNNDKQEDAQHPGQADHIVICVVGGITYKEAHQVQQVLNQYPLPPGSSITLLSTSTISSEEILCNLFKPFPIITLSSPKL